ncbi:MAG: fibronectin/fibrinogen-binding protein [Clostridiales bacterium]|nr:fibronectin/fibrinogen-binding protein [Clostridiales bacterium]
MPNDVITLNALSKELNELLENARIEKIYQPEKDEITFAMRKNGIERTLVISANSTHPRMHITTEKKENASTAPAFCMLLRKHLNGGSITSIKLLNCDRIIQIAIDARNELFDTNSYFLLAELMGRQSNIIITDSNYKILDAIKRVHLDQNTARHILPNLAYPFLSQPKIRLDDIKSLGKFFANNEHFTKEILIANIGGIGKETAKEILSSNKPFNKLIELYNIYESKQYAPCILHKGDTVVDYFITPYKSISGEYKKMPSLNHCFDYFYRIYDNIERKKTHTRKLYQLLKRLQNKNQNRIKHCNLKIAESEKAQRINEKGQLLLANIYKIKQGDKSIVCYDYYNDAEVEIELDASLSPSQNVQKYFKRYAKLKRAKEIAEGQIKPLYVQKEYLSSIESSIENCQTKQEFDEILHELENLSGINNKKPAKKKIKPSQPMHIKIDGFDVFIGKNSRQNVEVTFKIASSNDLWLHTKNYHGSHVIIKGNPKKDTLVKAAAIAAYYSAGRSSDKVEVDYTLRKYVKKIANSYMGLVTYINYKTIVVKPKQPDELQQY